MKKLYAMIFWLFGTTVALAYPTSFAPLVRETLPAVVSILGQTDMQNSNTQNNGGSAGSGFIYTKSGYIITNNHVVEGMTNIKAVLEDGTEYATTIVGTDALTDLAVLKIDDVKGANLPTLEFGDSDKIYVGDWVIAIGNPLRLGFTVTKGIVSARSRNIQMGLYDDFIQTDTPINRGNSGGPLINMEGKVVGINTMIMSPSGGSIGLGFSIPSNLVAYVATQIIENGEVVRGWIGVGFENMTSEIADSIDFDQKSGTLITSVQKNGPAYKGGIRPGDVVLEINGINITRKKRLPGIIAMSPIGKKIPVKIWRQGKIMNVAVVLVERSNDIASIQQGFGNGDFATNATIEEFGLEVSDITPEIANQYNIDPKIKGVIITGHANSNKGQFSRQFLPQGGIIVMINNIEINSVQMMKKIIDDAKQRKKRQVMFVLQTANGARLIATLPLQY